MVKGEVNVFLSCTLPNAVHSTYKQVTLVVQVCSNGRQAPNLEGRGELLNVDSELGGEARVGLERRRAGSGQAGGASPANRAWFSVYLCWAVCLLERMMWWGGSKAQESKSSRVKRSQEPGTGGSRL